MDAGGRWNAAAVVPEPRLTIPRLNCSLAIRRAAERARIRAEPNNRARERSGMIKQIATVAGVGLAVAFLVVFFAARPDSMELTDVAPRVGMSHEELLALGPRIASQTGVTLGTSRRVVYLLACSGQVNRQTLEEQATQAST